MSWWRAVQGVVRTEPRAKSDHQYRTEFGPVFSLGELIGVDQTQGTCSDWTQRVRVQSGSVNLC
jgi:hypothetical protein